MSNTDDELDKIMEKLDKQIVNGITISIATDGVFSTDNMLQEAKQAIKAYTDKKVTEVIKTIAEYETGVTNG